MKIVLKSGDNPLKIYHNPLEINKNPMKINENGLLIIIKIHGKRVKMYWQLATTPQIHWQAVKIYWIQVKVKEKINENPRKKINCLEIRVQSTGNPSKSTGNI